MKTKRKTNHRVPIALAVALILISFVASFAAQNADQVESEVCLECHDGYAETLAPTSHQLSSGEGIGAGPVDCVSCHSGAVDHTDDPSIDNIGNPSKMTAEEAFSLCTSCHKAHVAADEFEFDAHSSNGLNCSSCHQVHGGKPALLLDRNAQFCLSCHGEVSNQFSRQSKHPVASNNVTCLNCHQNSFKQDDNLSYDLKRVCQDCHPLQGGPFTFEHEPVSGYSVEGSGCIECHEPHGSENDHLLKQPDNNTCRQCHFPAGHQTAHGGIWSQRACQSCHIDTHGSHVSNLFLDPNLPAKLNTGLNCYSSSCHALNR